MINYNVGIIGAGLIGTKRAEALKEFDNCRLTAVADIDEAAAANLSQKFGCYCCTDWCDITDRDDIEIVIASVFNKYLAPVTISALKNRKHVLCEKPLGRNKQESKTMVETAQNKGVVLKTGFNHRHHPAIAQARQLLADGEIGDLIWMRCRYGHGGRCGYEKEWRADKDLCGGGELLDQGVHVADLFRWFAGDFNEAFGYTPTYFWDMEVEDNAFAMFRKDNGVIAAMHTSWTQWKNLFSFEVFGSKGYLIIEGLGGSYGTERLKFGRRRPESGPPDEKILEFPEPDISWQEEWKEFISAIQNRREPIGNGWDGYEANRMVEAIYESARTQQVVKL